MILSYYLLKTKIKKATGINLTHKQYNFINCPTSLLSETEKADLENWLSYAIIFYICLNGENSTCNMPSSRRPYFMGYRSTSHMILAYLNYEMAHNNYYMTWFNLELKRIYFLLQNAGIKVANINFYEKIKYKNKYYRF